MSTQLTFAFDDEDEMFAFAASHHEPLATTWKEPVEVAFPHAPGAKIHWGNAGVGSGGRCVTFNASEAPADVTEVKLSEVIEQGETGTELTPMHAAKMLARLDKGCGRPSPFRELLVHHAAGETAPEWYAGGAA